MPPPVDPPVDPGTRYDRPLSDDPLPPDLAEAAAEDHERIEALKPGVPVDPVQPAPTLQRRLYDECVVARWDPYHANTFAEEIAHLHEEVAEMFRAWRLWLDVEVRYDENGKPLGVPPEAADVAIGLFYIAERWGFDLLEAIEEKHRFNLTRDYVAEGRQLHAR